MARKRSDDIGWWWHAETSCAFPLRSLQRWSLAHVTILLTTSGFFYCSIDREYLYGYAADVADLLSGYV